MSLEKWKNYDWRGKISHQSQSVPHKSHMVVIRLSSEQKEGKDQQNSKREDKEVHAYCD
jgi:hypothetical protein